MSEFKQMKQVAILMIKFYHQILELHSSNNSLHNLFCRACRCAPYFIFFLSIVVFFNGCSREQPIKIGFIGGLTGRVADLGVSGRNGALLAIEQRNNSGGINGRLIHLTAFDDKQDKSTAENGFNSLVEQGMEAIIGHMTSSMSVVTAPLADKKHIVLMSPTSTTTLLDDIDDYFLRVCASTDNYGQKMARYLRNTKKLARVSVIYDLKNKAYTKSWIDHFSDEFVRLGGQIVQQVTYTSGPDVHFDNVASQALPNTEGVIISSSAVDAGMLCQQIRKLNSDVVIATSEWAATEKLLELGGIAVEEIVVSQFFNRFSTAPDYLKFKEEFIKRFGQEPGFASVGAYDATNVILEALAQKGKGQDLKEKILTIGSFDGVQGKIHINRYGDSDRETYLSIVRNGKFVSP